MKTNDFDGVYFAVLAWGNDTDEADGFILLGLKSLVVKTGNPLSRYY